jgi:enamine deaminase RidA (YjgF/YER057c/UK114 family)
VPEVVPPVAAYVPAARAGSLVFTSGQLPFRAGELMATGTLGDTVDPAVATDCARQCALNALGAIKALIGDLDQVERVVKLVVFVASTPDFIGQPAIANGASELMQLAFGEAGVHARSAVGLASLPLGAPVEVEVIVSLVS